MTREEEQQILAVIRQFEKNKKYVPYVQDLKAHDLYGDFFNGLNDEAIQEVEDMVRTYITTEIRGMSTKWGEMFGRFYDIHTELFRSFRTLNSQEQFVETDEFQEAGQKVEQILYTFEQILTRPMLKKPIWLAKVTESFYDIAYRFFPFYHRIG